MFFDWLVTSCSIFYSLYIFCVNTGFEECAQWYWLGHFYMQQWNLGSEEPSVRAADLKEFSTPKWDQIRPLWCRKGRGQCWVWAPTSSFIWSRSLLLWFTAGHTRLAGLWAFRASLASPPAPLWESVIMDTCYCVWLSVFLGIWTPVISFASQSLHPLGYLVSSQKCPYSMFLLYCLALYRTLGQT